MNATRVLILILQLLLISKDTFAGDNVAHNKESINRKLLRRHLPEDENEETKQHLDSAKIASEPIQSFLSSAVRHEIEKLVNLKFKQMRNDFNAIIAEEIDKLRKEMMYGKTSKECNCSRGPSGSQGPQGPPGKQGPQGERGPMGLRLYVPELRESNIYIEANISESSTAMCKFSGNPIPKVVWQLPTKHVQFETKIDRNSSEVKSIAILKHFTWEDRGSIKCIASSILGNAEGTGQLLIHRKPSIKTLPSTVYSHVGVPFVFPRCESIGYPKANISWTRGYMPTNKRTTIIENRTIEIASVSVTDEGFYICTAKNYLGQDETTVQLKTKPLSFSHDVDEFPIIGYNETITLSCSAAGDTKRMIGGWYSSRTNGKIPSRTNVNGYLFNVTTVVTQPGIYECQIRLAEEEITKKILVREYSFGSSLLSRNQAMKLYGWIGTQNKSHIHQFEQCWFKERGYSRLWVESSEISNYEKQCKTEFDIILLMQDTYGNLFGGYKSKKLEKDFLFDFSKGMMFQRKAASGQCYGFGPCFHNGLYFEDSTSYRSQLRYSSNLNNNFDGKGYSYLGRSTSGTLSAFEFLQIAAME